MKFRRFRFGALMALILSFALISSPSFASDNASCSADRTSATQLDRNELLAAVDQLEKIVAKSSSETPEKYDARVLLSYKCEILGGFSSHVTISGKDISRTMLYAKIGSDYIVAGYDVADNEERLAKSFRVDSDGQLSSPNDSPRFTPFMKSAVTMSVCPAGQSKRCTYSWDCVKNVAPGWAITVCGFLPGNTAKTACVAATAASYLSSCCRLVCQSDFN